MLIKKFDNWNENNIGHGISKKLLELTKQVFGKRMGRKTYISNRICECPPEEQMKMREKLAKRMGHTVDIMAEKYERKVVKDDSWEENDADDEECLVESESGFFRLKASIT